MAMGCTSSHNTQVQSVTNEIIVPEGPDLLQCTMRMYQASNKPEIQCLDMTILCSLLLLLTTLVKQQLSCLPITRT